MEKNGIENMQNLYEVRKTIRFELKPLNFIYKSENKISYELSNLIVKHKDFIDLLSKTLFYKEIEVLEKKESKKLNVFGNFFTENNFEISKNEEEDFSKYEIYKTVYLKYKGIKQIFKSEWLENKKEITLQRDKEDKTIFVLDEKGKYKKKNKNYMTMGDLGERNFIRPYFEKILVENYYSNKELENLDKKENFLARKSDILFEIQKLNSKDLLGNLYFLFEGGYIEHKNDVNIIDELKNKLSEIKNIINNFLEDLKPSQSFGLMMDHISLNYYTRSKTEKMYDVEILKKQEELDKKYQYTLGELYGIDKIQGIKNLYEKTKTFKANQKSAFLQLLQNKIKYNEFKKPFTFTDNKEIRHENYEIKLFDDVSEENYNKMLDLTNQIEKETDKKKRTEFKEKRGKHFMPKYSCKKYVNFCNEYKKVTIEYGKRKAEKMSLEREKIESRKERGFGIISTDGKSHFLNTFSVENTKKAYENFKKDEYKSKNEIEYFILSSITLRALEKLCFKENSSFMKDILGNIDSKYTKTIEQGEKGKVKVLKFKKELEEENIYVSFLNEILDKQTTLGLILKDGEESKKTLKSSQNIDEFEINLKKETYVLDNFFMSKMDFEESIKKLEGKTYEITSWDLKKERKKPEFYTKTWFNFWDENNSKDKFPIRINPELNIGFVEKNEEWKKEEKNENQTNNRRNRDRFLMFSTFSYNADSKYINNAFIKDNERIKSIEDFNKSYDSSKNQYFYGLDKGVLELATLGIYKNKGNKISSVKISSVEKDENWKKEEKIEIYKITPEGFKIKKEVVNKNGETKTHYLKNNPSLFIDDYINDNSVFEKQNIISCLGDLSCAKVIKGKVILNADINTYNKLQEINVKRLLYKAITEGKCKSNIIKYHQDKNVFSYIFENRGKDEEKKFNFGKNINVTDFEKDLNEYMKHVRDKNSDIDVSIIKINNLKNAICANIVGVIIELQKYYPGFIVLENIGNAWVDEEENKGNIVVGNLINEKIYNKLELLNEVPPILKKFRSEIKENIQHGKVIYINKDATSSACPVCEENKILLNKKDKEIFKLGGHLSNFEKEMKHLTNEEYQEWQKNESFKKTNTNKRGEIEKNKYLPGNMNGQTCNFQIGDKENYKGFSFITSGDDLATYNIAKRGLEYINSLTQKLP